MPAYKAKAGQQSASALGMAALELALHLQAQGREIDDHGNDDEADQIGITEKIKHGSVLRSKPSIVNTSRKSKWADLPEGKPAHSTNYRRFSAPALITSFAFCWCVCNLRGSRLIFQSEGRDIDQHGDDHHAHSNRVIQKLSHVVPCFRTMAGILQFSYLSTA